MVKKQTDKKRTAIIIAAVALAAIAGIWHYTTISTVDYGITSAYIDCDGDNYIFSGSFYTWRIGTHQVQVFCDDNPRYHILNFYEKTTPASGTYDWSVTYDADDFNALMPCDRVWFQLYDTSSMTVFFKTKEKSLPDCGTSPTPTPTTPAPTPTVPSPTPTAPAPTPTNGNDDDTVPDTDTDYLIYGGVAVFLLLLYFAFRKKE